MKGRTCGVYKIDPVQNIRQM